MTVPRGLEEVAPGHKKTPAQTKTGPERHSDPETAQGRATPRRHAREAGVTGALAQQSLWTRAADASVGRHSLRSNSLECENFACRPVFPQFRKT